MWRLEAYADGLPVVHAAGLLELLYAHPDATPDGLKAALAAVGWQDMTTREAPRGSWINPPIKAEARPDGTIVGADGKPVVAQSGQTIELTITKVLDQS